MEYIDHDHKHTVKRGGSIMSGNSNYDDNIVLDTPEYSKHDLSHTWKGTAKMGVINVPLNLHVLPGDSLRISPNISQRFRPLVAPITGSLETVQHTWYVPYRKCDYGFEKQLTGGVAGTYKANLLHFVIPQLGNSVSGVPLGDLKCFGVPIFAAGSLFDQMNYGHRSAVVETTGVFEDDYLEVGAKPSALSLVAYHRVYNDFYRPKEVETDLWCEIEQPDSLLNYFTKLYNALHAANSSITWTATLWKDEIMETIWGVLRTNADFTGFAHYMLWLLSSPDAVPVLASYYGVDYPSGQTNASYNRANHRLMLSGLNGTRAHQNSVGYCIDFFAAIFQAYLICPEFFPWERDRFTTALPYLMRGQQVALETAIMAATNDVEGVKAVSSSPSITGYQLPKFDYVLQGTDTDSYSVELATGFSIQELRRVNAWTRFLERNARIGYVFDEWLEGVFGIATKKSDHLTRPVYVGGSIQNADVETILSTAETTDANIGDYRGYATSYGGGSYDFSVAEHGVILGILATRPRSTYLNTCDRNNFKYGDRTLFFTPDFAHLSEQPVFSAEVDSMTGNTRFADWLNDDWNDEDEENLTVGVNIFGYEPRYNEYRSMPSTTHGELKTSLAYFSNARTAYDWLNNLDHVGDEIPNDVFFQHVFPDSEAINRIFQVSGEMADHFVLSVGWKIDSLREVPRQATPSL